MTPTPTVEAESRETLAAQLRELRSFLDGSGTLDGDFAFGEWDHVTTVGGHKAAFWWRKHLKRIDAAVEALSAPSPATGGVETTQAAFDATMVEEIIDTIKAHPDGRFSERQKVELMLELSPAYASPPPIAGPTKEDLAERIYRSVVPVFEEISEPSPSDYLPVAADILALFNGAGR